MVVVATWNLENLFSEGPSAPSDRAVYQAKLTGIAATVARAAVDVLGLQEVGDDTAFDDLLAALGRPWAGVACSLRDSRGIRVAVVSRLPVLEDEEVAELPPALAPLQASDSGAVMTRMGRGALRLRVQAGTGPLDVVSCHLKSKLLTYPGGRFAPRDEGERARYAAYALYRRAAEATAVRHFADRLLSGQGTRVQLVVLGDLNDEPAAATTQILHGPSGSELGTAGALRPDAGDAWRLFNLAPLLPEGQRASRVYRGRGELIDHLLVSRVLLPTVESVSAHAAGPLPSITEVASERKDATVSDHALVAAALDLA